MKLLTLALIFLMMSAALAQDQDAGASDSRQGHLLEATLELDKPNLTMDQNNESVLIVTGEVYVTANFPTQWKLQKVNLYFTDKQGYAFGNMSYIPYDINHIWYGDGYGQSKEFDFSYHRFDWWERISKIHAEAWVYDYSTGDIIIIPLEMPTKIIPYYEPRN